MIEWGAATFTLLGQTETGDRYVVTPFGPGTLVAAIDGLGHGDEAASAARLAASILALSPHESMITLVRRCHDQLRRTRGVVMSLASFNALDETMTWLGVGNVEGRLLRANRDSGPPCEFLLLRGGVIGGELPSLDATVIPVVPGDTLVFATDGVALPSIPQVLPRERAQAAAEHILAKQKKETDDALVVVARWVGTTR